MTLVGWVQIALVLALALGCAIPLSKYIADVYASEKACSARSWDRSSGGFYRLAGVDPARSRTGSPIRSRCSSFPSQSSRSLRRSEAPRPACR
jgi:K+-transporting ATPase A subunit